MNSQPGSRQLCVHATAAAASSRLPQSARALTSRVSRDPRRRRHHPRRGRRVHDTSRDRSCSGRPRLKLREVELERSWRLKASESGGAGRRAADTSGAARGAARGARLQAASRKLFDEPPGYCVGNQKKCQLGMTGLNCRTAVGTEQRVKGDVSVVVTCAWSFSPVPILPSISVCMRTR